MELAEIVQELMTRPSAPALWRLYGLLLVQGRAADRPLVQVVEAFQRYLCDLQGKASARQYSELASLLDMGALGSIAIQNLISGEGRDFLRRALLGSVSESLMVLASRQYIRGWMSELHHTHCQAAWFLVGEIWQMSLQMQPELPAADRWALVDKLLQPARDAAAPNELRALLLARLFQIVLVNRLLPYLTNLET